MDDWRKIVSEDESGEPTNVSGSGEDDLAVYNIAELRDGLTLDVLQDQHSWIFNCDFRDAVLGLDENGRVVWYDGEFISGEWLGALPAPDSAGADGGAVHGDAQDDLEFKSDCVKYGKVAAQFRQQVESTYGVRVELSQKSAVLKGDVRALGQFKSRFESRLGKGLIKFVGRDIYVPFSKMLS